MAIEKSLLDQLLAGRDAKEVFSKDGLLDDLKKTLSERILNAELDEHLGGERADGNPNRRNGHSKKTVLAGTSKLTLSIPRDRSASFDRSCPAVIFASQSQHMVRPSGTEAPGARRCGQADPHDEPRARVISRVTASSTPTWTTCVSAARATPD
jgi:hypothetical protein